MIIDFECMKCGNTVSLDSFVLSSDLQLLCDDLDQHLTSTKKELEKLKGDLRMVAAWAINENSKFISSSFVSSSLEPHAGTYKLWLDEDSPIYDILEPWLTK